jgi:hypothetical protein
LPRAAWPFLMRPPPNGFSRTSTTTDSAAASAFAEASEHTTGARADGNACQMDRASGLEIATPEGNSPVMLRKPRREIPSKIKPHLRAIWNEALNGGP